MSAAVDTSKTPYQLIGGADVVRAVVNSFYDLMETDPTYAALRTLHGPDLAPMRTSLSGFLIGWMGGPRDWFDEHPGKCMMSLHAKVTVTAETAGQWSEAMARAVSDSGVDPAFAIEMNEVLGRMAKGMVR